MRVKIHTVGEAAILLGSITAVISVITAVLCGNEWWECIIIAAAAFLSIMLASKFIFSRYVLFRIKPLYQLMLSKDIHTSRLSKELRKRVGDEMVDDIHDSLENLLGASDSELDRLRQKEMERTEFLNAVFHEIRTPIFNIEGYTQTLLDGALEDPEVNRKFLERTMRSARRLSVMVEDIDRIARYEAGGGMIMYKEDFDILDLVYEVIDVNIVYSQEKNIKFKVSTATFPARGPIMVHADRLRISQVLDSIFRNAIQFNNYDGTVTVSFIDMFDKILVETTDSGIGIPAKDQPRIFEKFYRVDKSRSSESGGPGLGLYATKGIIDAHGENITARSEEGVGTTFSFTILKAKK